MELTSRVEKKSMSATAKAGFSLIEIMIAVTIMAILSVVILPNFLSYLNSAKQGKAKQTLKTVEQAVDQFYLDVGQYPTRLKDLVNAPADEKIKKKWRQGGYFKTKDLPQDPWDNNFQYKVNEPGADHPYELFSYGAKGKGSPKAEQISVWDK